MNPRLLVAAIFIIIGMTYSFGCMLGLVGNVKSQPVWLTLLAMPWIGLLILLTEIFK